MSRCWTATAAPAIPPTSTSARAIRLTMRRRCAEHAPSASASRGSVDAAQLAQPPDRDGEQRKAYQREAEVLIGLRRREVRVAGPLAQGVNQQETVQERP